LITQGIQRGIDQYKRQQKEKARDLNKRHKKITREKEQSARSSDDESQVIIVYRQHWIPWLLLIHTWKGIGIKIVVK